MNDKTLYTDGTQVWNRVPLGFTIQAPRRLMRVGMPGTCEANGRRRLVTAVVIEDIDYCETCHREDS